MFGLWVKDVFALTGFEGTFGYVSGGFTEGWFFNFLFLALADGLIFPQLST